MIILFILIPLSIVTAAIFLLGFFWAVRTGQYEDTFTPGMRVLADENQQDLAENGQKMTPKDDTTFDKGLAKSGK